MAEKGGSSRVSAAKPPTIALPPRSSVEALFTGGFGLSPGPLTLVSNFFDSGSCSFSQLLAGAMASPVAGITGIKPSFLADNSTDCSSKETNQGDGGERNLGFKQNRPMNLVVGHSPMFMVPPGLSPSVLLNSPGFFSPTQSPFGMSHQQALAQVTARAALSQSYMHMQAEYQSSSLAASADVASNATIQQPVDTVVSESEPESSTMEYSDVSHSDKKSLPPSLAVDKPAIDGYNWRKYGQKQVKASDYPRSYYKCTHPNCPVKKKVERNLEGQITEIIYKGQHNHELPQPNKRAKGGGGDPNGSNNSQARPELGSQIQTEWNRSNETIHSNSVSTQLTHVHLPQSSDQKELVDAEIGDGDDDEPNPKRRNTAVGASEVAVSHKTVTEPRVIVQTRSEVDLLDDGYKWRKYGQKVVKGNPNPRSYYKCTSVGCSVRKHVERSSTDPKAVVTTYEGKHNHDLPAARNSSNTTQLKPQRMVAEKPALLDQRPVLLQLKEERITV
ncbi:probable WRKY transcription factor 4 [Cornus florida]|uniref:probable WRKY transcription factor 4 n=1 Tax=Cornus florida TaxID=4283 RepID=UPI0028991E86|nr:probable WRKY transcription factor 4 [Cornus florida]